MATSNDKMSKSHPIRLIMRRVKGKRRNVISGGTNSTDFDTDDGRKTVTFLSIYQEGLLGEGGGGGLGRSKFESLILELNI